MLRSHGSSCSGKLWNGCTKRGMGIGTETGKKGGGIGDILVRSVGAPSRFSFPDSVLLRFVLVGWSALNEACGGGGGTTAVENGGN